jgi:hypothetical protein
VADKEDALQDIVKLARHNNITLGEIQEALRATSAGKPPSSLLSKLFGYFGGILVFAGICVFVGMQWDSMGKAAHVIITLGTGFVLFLMALATLTDERYARAATPLFLASSLFQPTGILVMLKEYGHGGDERYAILFMAGVMLIQHGATFWAKRRTIMAFTSITFGSIFFATLFNLMEITPNLCGTVFGASLMCIAYALTHSRHAAIAAFWYLVGSLSLLLSVFDAVKDTSYEIVSLGITAFMIFLSTFVRSRTLLFVSTIAMLCYISYFTEEHFAHTLGWPISLIICGLALLGMGSFAMKLNNKYIKQKG